MNAISSKKERKNWLFIIIGTGLLAVAIKCIYDPVGLVTGGFTGIAIITKQISMEYLPFEIPLWLTNLILNIPLFVLGYKIKGAHFLGKTVIATFLLSGWLYILPNTQFVSDDFLLVSVFGGVISGAGIGLILMAQATTGGTEMVAALIQHKIRHYSIAQIMQVLDAAIVLAGLYFLGIKPALYAIVSIFIVTKISDAVTEGVNFSKAAFIITDKYELISQAIIEELNRGVTGLSAKGMYSGEKKCMLYCVVSKKEIVNLKEIVLEIDSNAFVIVTDAREVLGEGFIEYEDI